MRPRAWCLSKVVATFVDDQLVSSKTDGLDAGEDQPEGAHHARLRISCVNERVRPRSFPLCVDYDGMGLQTKLLHKSVCLLVKQSRASLLLVPLYILRSNSMLKREIAARVWSNIDSFLVCEPVMALL